MQYPNDPTTLEASDIAAVYAAGDFVTLPDGSVGLPLIVTVRSVAGKPYPTVPFPQRFFVTNGVEPRILAIQSLPTEGPPLVDPPPAAETATIAESAPEASATSPEPEATPTEPAIAAETAPATPETPTQPDDAEPTPLGIGDGATGSAV